MTGEILCTPFGCTGDFCRLVLYDPEKISGICTYDLFSAPNTAILLKPVFENETE